MPRGRLIEDLCDLVGVRIGLATDEIYLYNALQTTEYEPILFGSHDSIIRIRSDEVESLAALTLAKFGERRAEEGPFAVMRTALRLWQQNRNREEIMRRLLELIAPSLPRIAGKDIFFISSFPTTLSLIDTGYYSNDPDKNQNAIGLEQMQRVSDTLAQEFGPDGRTVAQELFNSIHTDRAITLLFSRIQRFTSDQQLALSNLFYSQKIDEKVFDQRYIDFLAANLDDVDRINWRQFEALCAEYFSRQGYKVRLGPGANDNGVDIRIWPEDGNESAPPLILAQCKRQKSRVSKAVVKALWADVTFENANMGLVATTSDLEPGADVVRRSRGYPIEVANREAIHKWINELRTPQRGLFLPETLS